MCYKALYRNGIVLAKPVTEVGDMNKNRAGYGVFCSERGDFYLKVS